jgi:hypothetical protein
MTEAARQHRMQLQVCHEKLMGRKSQGGHEQPGIAFCNLSAYAWCYECSHYVCDIHLNSRHEGHDTVIEFPDKSTKPGTKEFKMGGR